MQIKPTIVTYLDTRRKKKSGRYPVKLRITFRKEQRYYLTGFDLSQDEFEATRSDTKIKQLPIKLRRQLQDVKFKSDAQVVKANEVINKIPDWTTSYR